MSEERHPFGLYFRAIADRLELRDWTITLSSQWCGDGFSAQIECTPGRKRAVVFLASSFASESPEEQRQTACHELIHCHHESAKRTAEIHLSAEAFRAWMLQTEYAIDAIADAIAPHMPLPCHVQESDGCRQDRQTHGDTRARKKRTSRQQS